MRKGVVLLLALLGSAAGAAAQQPAATQPQNPTVPFASRGAIGNLNAQQTLGLRLFNQSCQVCHTQATLNSALWGPALSQEALGGDDKALHDKIAAGGPLMLGGATSTVPQRSMRLSRMSRRCQRPLHSRGRARRATPVHVAQTRETN
jgi:mono/diheme cytochrome c family protein